MICSKCGQNKKHQALGMCPNCYSHQHFLTKIDQAGKKLKSLPRSKDKRNLSDLEIFRIIEDKINDWNIDLFKSIFFCLVNKYNNQASRRACNLSIKRFIRLKNLILKFIAYYSFYLQNKKELDLILKTVLPVKQRILIFYLVQDPFNNWRDLAEHFKISKNSVERRLSRSYRGLIIIGKDNLLLKEFLKLFLDVVGGHKRVMRYKN